MTKKIKIRQLCKRLPYFLRRKRMTGLVRLSRVEHAADILIKIMPMLFIPSVVRMMESVFFGCALSLGCYWIGVKIAGRFPYTICNPLLISSILVILVLSIFWIEYDVYNQSAEKLTWLLTPATVALAVPMYRKIEMLKKNLAAIFVSLLSGCIAGMVTIWGLCKVLKMPDEESVLERSSFTGTAPLRILSGILSEYSRLFF